MPEVNIRDASSNTMCQCCGSREGLRELFVRHWIVIVLCAKCRKKLAKKLVNGEEDL